MNCRKLIWAKSWGGSTLLGVNLRNGYPLEGGNCFSVLGEDGEHYRIVNFVAENLEELEKRGLTWPIKIEVLGRYTAAIADRRVPPEWYKDNFCTVCTPSSLLPYPQRLQQLLQVERGERTENNGIVSISCERPKEFEYADAEYRERRKKIEENMKKWTVRIGPTVQLDENGVEIKQKNIEPPFVETGGIVINNPKRDRK